MRNEDRGEYLFQARQTLSGLEAAGNGYSRLSGVCV